MTTTDQVLQIITRAGGKSYRRPYNDDDMQRLLDVIYDAVHKWGGDDLSQIDTKRMALDALILSICDIQDIGDTAADIDEITQAIIAEAQDLIQVMQVSALHGGATRLTE